MKKLNLHKKLKDSIDVDQILPKFRMEYSKGVLLEKKVHKNPMLQFTTWFEEAVLAKIPCPNAMSLATVSNFQGPAVRIVLLKKIEPESLVFFSSYQSEKAKEMDQNRQIAIALFWPEMERQIRISGHVIKISLRESESYYQTRPRGAQLAAWIAPQSSPVLNREALEKGFAKIKKQFTGKEVPRPPHWGGYRMIPSSFEFWQGRANRLNDRLRYTRQGKSGWKIQRLKP